ncbi:MAG: M28 family peptidase [Chloroflexota bacterium]
MNHEALAKRAQQCLQMLCADIPNRAVGSPGNRQAADYIARQFAAHGWDVRTPSFDCLHWQTHGCTLEAGGSAFTAQVSPYSNGGTFHAPLAVASDLAQLEASDLAGQIVLLGGDLTREQLMPKNFTFYNPEHHQRLIHLLEQKAPLAIIAATARDAEMAGALYPFPLFEDGDFDIPSVFLTEEEGARLAVHAGSPLRLDIRARREPALGCNVVAQRATQIRSRVVFFAHLDAKPGTPGALDNAAGVTILILLAELLAAYPGRLGIELVALNGEDYYSNPGEMLYLSENEGRFGEICLGINIDGAGYHEGAIAYSLYECPARVADGIRAVMARHTGLVEGEPWVQGDHALFLMNGVPALAITSQRAFELMTTLVHTDADTPEQVDPRRLAQTALVLRDLVDELDDWL